MEGNIVIVIYYKVQTFDHILKNIDSCIKFIDYNYSLELTYTHTLSDIHSHALAPTLIRLPI